jgi:putative ABC transport system substrate-binding protein
MAGKWLEILKEGAPHIAQVGLLFNPDTAPYVPTYYLPSFKAVAAALAIEPIDARVYRVADLADTIAELDVSRIAAWW